MCCDLAFCVHALPGQDLNAFGVFAHAVCGAVEDCGLTIGAENFQVEHCEDGAGCCQSYEHETEVESLLCCTGGLFADGEVLPGHATSVVYYGDGPSFGCGRSVRGGILGCEARIERSYGGDCWAEAGAEDEQR